MLGYIVQEARKLFSLKQVSIQLPDDPALASERFREMMRQALSDGRSNILVIFDEIENISPETAASEHWKAGRDTLLFWQTLRSFFQSDFRYKMTFCFVGTNPRLFESPKIGDVANPVYLFAPKTFLQPLTLSDTREMCGRLGGFMGLDFDDSVLAEIHRRFGGHPFFVRQLCSGVHLQAGLSRPLSVSIGLCDRAQLSISASIKKYINDILQTLEQFYPEEYQMIVYLASGDRLAFNDMARDYPEWTEHLIGYGIVVQRGEDYEFSFEAIRDALMPTGAAPAKTLEDRRAEINSSRNKLEEEMRSALFGWAVRLHDEEWRNACTKCIPKIFEKSPSIGIREAFSRRNSPLYFLDLLKFIDYSGLGARNAEELSRIKAALNTVNALRIDAHAKALTDREYEDWLSSMQILEAVYLPPD